MTRRQLWVSPAATSSAISSTGRAYGRSAARQRLSKRSRTSTALVDFVGQLLP